MVMEIFVEYVTCKSITLVVQSSGTINNHVLRSIIRHVVVVYFGDILIYSKKLTNM